MRRWVLSIVALVLMAGCGDDSPEKTPPLSHIEYVQRADGICFDEKRLNQAFPFGVETPEQEVQAYEDLADFLETVSEELEALTPPVEDRKLIERWLLARRQQIQTLREEIPDAIESESNDKAQAVQREMLRLQRIEYSTAAEFGMDICSLPPDERPPGRRGEPASRGPD